MEEKEGQIGSLVQYVLEGGSHRPAVVVNDWGNGCVNLQVFTDSDPEGLCNDKLPQIEWKTSILKSEEENDPHTWHWPER